MKRTKLMRQIQDIAKANDVEWTFVRQGANHEVWRFGSLKVTVPTAPKHQRVDSQGTPSRRPRRGEPMKRYNVHAVRQDKWWALKVPAVRGVHSQVRRLSDAPDMATDALALALDEDPSHIEVKIVVDLTDEMQALIDKAKERRARAEQLRDEAAAASRDAVRALVGAGLTQKDAATVLGVSFQRVSQLARGS